MSPQHSLTVAGIQYRRRTYAIYEAIKKHWHTNHQAATMADIARATGFSKSTVYNHVTILALRGYVTYHPNIHRTLTPAEERPA